MSISIKDARRFIMEAPKYRGSVSWKERVLRMPENQVLAIYRTMLRRGEFDKKKEVVEPAKPEYRQMTIFDVELGGLRVR